jgi:serine/threonine protein kinase
VKVADLGLLKQLQEPTEGHSHGMKPPLPRTNSFVGTTMYMSPERIDGKEYSFPSDVWAFGLSMITIALGRFPLETQGGYWAILHGIRDAPPPVLPSTFSKECRDFVAQCMKRNPDERKTVVELLKHPFLQKTVVEDLTFNQDYSRGKNELLSVIDAIYEHIREMKQSIVSQTRDDIFWKEASFLRVFGVNLEESTALEALTFVLFGEFPKASSSAAGAEGIAGEGAEEASSNTGVRSRILNKKRPMLINLSKQLHMSIESVEKEARDHLNVLGSA